MGHSRRLTATLEWLLRRTNVMEPGSTGSFRVVEYSRAPDATLECLASHPAAED